jgi:hypothetical protein
VAAGREARRRGRRARDCADRAALSRASARRRGRAGISRHDPRRRHTIYIENQYLTSAGVGDALVERLGSDDCPEVVIVITHSSSGWLEEATMGVMRARLIERLRDADRCRRLRVYYCAQARMST